MEIEEKKRGNNGHLPGGGKKNQKINEYRFKNKIITFHPKVKLVNYM